MARAPWWQSAIIYQIYPRSFQDSGQDGVGDLLGITRRLPYFVELGIDAIWISPIFPSPMADFGYDISDYTGIAPLFGTLKQFDALLAAAHALGIRVLLDLVPNHTSDRHPWFIESRASRSNAKREWYIWRDPAPDGGPPNNWLSEFGGSAWTLEPDTGQYYYHAFLAAQPDLNWRNAEVRAAIYAASMAFASTSSGTCSRTTRSATIRRIRTSSPASRRIAVSSRFTQRICRACTRSWPVCAR